MRLPADANTKPAALASRRGENGMAAHLEAGARGGEAAFDDIKWRKRRPKGVVGMYVVAARLRRKRVMWRASSAYRQR